VHVALRASDGRVLAEADRTFAVLPEPAPISAERSRFGTHTRLDPRHLALAARLGFRWLRLHDASLVGQWLVAEPEPRRFRWFDESIDRARRMGFAILGVLEGTPRWASSAPPSTGWYEARAFPPRDPAAWRRYVGAAVAHYRGRVDAWEVWNEPYFDAFWRAPPEAYRALLADAIAAAHAASPAVTVLASGCGQASCRPWQAIALGPLAPIERAAIADRPIDDSHDRLAAQGPHAIAFHAYDFRLVAADEDLAARVAAERALLGPSVRLWDTEGAAPGAVGSSLPSAAPGAFTADPERDGAAFVRWAVEGFAAGVERAFAYALVESEFANDSDLALLDPDGAPRPAACALAVLSARLRDLRFLRSERRGPWTARVFGDARGELAIAIADGLGALTVAAPGARDVFGNPLAPGARARAVYLEAPDRPSLDRLLDTRLGD